MKVELWERKSIRGFYLIFALVLILMVPLGYFYLTNEVEGRRTEALRQLKSTAILKAKLIEEWSDDKISDTRVIGQSPLLQDAILTWLTDQVNLKLKNEILARFRIVLENDPDYSDIYIVEFGIKTKEVSSGHGLKI